MPNNEQLSLLLEMHDREWHYYSLPNELISALFSLGLVESSENPYHSGTRITGKGLAITSAAITAANGVK